MDFFTAVRILARRWPITLLGLLLTIAASTAVYGAVAPVYEATGQYFLLVPSIPSSGDPSGSDVPGEVVSAEQLARLNPYLGYGNLQIVTELVARKMNSQSVAQSLKENGATGDYLVDIVPGQSPSISVTTSGDDADAVLATHRIVTERLRLDLEALQQEKGAPEFSWITLDSVFEPNNAVFQRGSKIRAAAAIAILGLGGSLVGVFLIEGVISTGRTPSRRHRSRRAAVLAASAAADPPPSSGEPPPSPSRRTQRPAARGNDEAQVAPSDEEILAVVAQESARGGGCSIGTLAGHFAVPTETAVAWATPLLDSDRLVRTKRGSLQVPAQRGSSAVHARPGN